VLADGTYELIPESEGGDQEAQVNVAALTEAPDQSSEEPKADLVSDYREDNQLHAGRPVRPVQLHTEDSPCARMERFCSVPAVAGASMESEGERVPPHHSREIHRERERECSGACSYMYNQEAGAAGKRDTRSTSITRSL